MLGIIQIQDELPVVQAFTSGGLHKFRAHPCAASPFFEDHHVTAMLRKTLTYVLMLFMSDPDYCVIYDGEFAPRRICLAD